MSLRYISNQLGMSKSGLRFTLLRAGQELGSRAPKVTHKRSLKSGKQVTLPYDSFCYFEGKVVKDPREFPNPQKIHRLWGQGRTKHQINLELNRAKLLSRTGKTWSSPCFFPGRRFTSENEYVGSVKPVRKAQSLSCI